MVLWEECNWVACTACMMTCIWYNSSGYYIARSKANADFRMVSRIVLTRVAVLKLCKYLYIHLLTNWYGWSLVYFIAHFCTGVLSILSVQVFQSMQLQVASWSTSHVHTKWQKCTYVYLLCARMWQARACCSTCAALLPTSDHIYVCRNWLIEYVHMLCVE